MAKTNALPVSDYAMHNPSPRDLKDHIFYGLVLDPSQEHFRDAIWTKSNRIVFCNSIAGTGKTLVAVATAALMVEHGLYKYLKYIAAPYGTDKLGFLRGDLDQKAAPYYDPLYQALVKLGYDPMRVIKQSGVCDKTGECFVECRPHTFLRGMNLEDSVVIIDEAQNYTVPDLKKTLTRVCDSSKVIVIGHNSQKDINGSSGFTDYLKWFEKEPYCEVCTLTNNHRGIVSRKADELSI